MTALPSWADNTHGRALIIAILAKRPDFFLRRYAGSRYNGEIVYKGKLAGQLRRMHSDWLDQQLAALDARYAETGEWPDRDHSPLAVEDGNALIRRLLSEDAGLTEVHGDPVPAHRRAA